MDTHADSSSSANLCSISVNEDFVLIYHSIIFLPPSHCTSYLLHGLNHSSLIVGQHDGDKHSVWTESRHHFLVVHCPGSGASWNNAELCK